MTISGRYSQLLIICLYSVSMLACGEDPEIAKQSFFESGNEYFDQELYEEAIIEYRNAIQQDPRFGEARLKLAESLILRGNPAAAFRQQIRAADLLPENVDAQLTAAAMLLAAEQFEDAETRARGALDLDPDNIDAQIVLGNALAGLRDLDGAVAQLEEAIEVDPEQARSYASLGALQAMRGDAEGAEEAFKKAIDVEPEEVGAHLALANYLWSSGRLDEAEASLEEALLHDPTNALANRALASLYLTSNRAAEAEEPLKLLAEQNTESIGPQMQLTQYYLRIGRLDDAKARLNDVAERPGGWGLANTALAALEYAEGNEPAGHNLVDQVITQEPQNVSALLTKGRFLITEANYDAALEVVNGAVFAGPDNPTTHYTLATIYAQQRKYQEAIESYNEVLRLNPVATAAQLELSRLLLLTGDALGSVELSEEALASNPVSPVGRLTLARSLMAAGELTRAESLMVELVEEFPRAAIVHAQYGTLHLAKEDTVSAQRAYEQAYELNSGSLEALGGLMAIDVRAGRTADARLRVDRQLANAPNNTALLVLAARAYAADQDLVAAEEALRTAVQIDPSTLDAYSLLGQLYVTQGKLQEAQAEFELLAERQPRDVGALTMVAMLLEVQGRVSEAMRRYETVLERDPRAAVAANNLAWHYSSGEADLNRALELAQIAKEELPDRHEVNDTLGWVYYRMGLPASAIPPLAEAVDQQPDNPSYHYHLGMAEMASDDPGKGEQSLARALSIGSEFEGADEARETLAAIRGGQ